MNTLFVIPNCEICKEAKIAIIHVNVHLDPKERIQVVDAYSGDPRLKRVNEFFKGHTPSFPICFIEKPKVTATKYGTNTIGKDVFAIHGAFDAEHYEVMLRTLFGIY